MILNFYFKFDEYHVSKQNISLGVTSRAVMFVYVPQIEHQTYMS